MQPNDPNSYGTNGYDQYGQPLPPQPQPQWPLDPWTMPDSQPVYYAPAPAASPATTGRGHNVWIKRGIVIAVALLLLILMIVGVVAMTKKSGDRADSITSSEQEGEGQTEIDKTNQSDDADGIAGAKEASLMEVCPSGYDESYETGSLACEKWEETTTQAKVTYTCASGYTLRGSGDNTECFKVAGGTIERKSATKSAYCPSGTKAVGSSCEKTLTAKAVVEYKCPSGYTRSGTTCKKTIQSSTIQAACTAGYTKTGSGASTKCKKTVTATKDVITYTCPSGYTKSGAGTATKCTKVETINAIANPHCSGLGNYSKVVKVSGKDRCVYQKKNAVAKTPVCDSGYTLSADKKKCTRTISATVASITCPAGYTYDGTGKCKKGTATVTPTYTYKCTSPYTLSGAKCTYTKNSTTPYVCPSGWTSISGSGTATVCQHNTTKAPGYTYSCTSGYTLNSKTAKCSRTLTKAYIATQTYKCTSPYVLSGATCIHTLNAKLSCAKGTVSGNYCAWVDSKSATKSTICRSGYRLTGTSCVKVERSAKKITYSCAAGFSKSGETTCVRQAGGTVKTVKATASAPTCAKGYTLEGSSCTKRTLVTEQPTKEYRCDTGWSLREGEGDAIPTCISGDE